jgi:hypothetical protein
MRIKLQVLASIAGRWFVPDSELLLIAQNAW